MTYFTANLTPEEEEVRDEMARQDAKWGQQNHADGTDSGDFSQVIAQTARQECQFVASEGRVTWTHILREEVSEAFAETDPEALLAELLQVEAVARQWRMAIRRRLAATRTPGQQNGAQR